MDSRVEPAHRRQRTQPRQKEYAPVEFRTDLDRIWRGFGGIPRRIISMVVVAAVLIWWDLNRAFRKDGVAFGGDDFRGQDFPEYEMASPRVVG